MDTPVNFPQKRETGEIYRDSLKFLRGEWKPLARILAIYVLPFILIYASAQVFMQMKLTGSAEVIRDMDPDKLVKEIGPLYKNLMITLAFYLFVQSLFMAAVFSYIQMYLIRGRNGFSSGEVVPNLSSNALLAVGATFSVALVSFWGLFLLIIPGLILANSLSLTPFIAIYERKGIYPALLRSFTLTGKAWWHTLVLNLTGILILWGVNILLTLPITASTTLAEPASGGTSPNPILETWQWVYTGASLGISSLFVLVAFLFQAFQYFNLTTRYPETPVNLKS